MARPLSPVAVLMNRFIETFFMSRLFYPAAVLMNRFRYPAKFTLINAFVALAIGLLLGFLVTNLRGTIDLSRKELAAIELLRPLAHQVQLTQQHRGLSAGVLNGNTAMQDKLMAKQAEVEAAVAAVSQTEARLRPMLGLGDDWMSIRQEWERLRADSMRLSSSENFAAHGALIGHALRYQATVADAGVLTGDPDIDTFYLIDSLVRRLPEMLERLGQTRAKGTGTLARKEMSEQERIEFAVHVSMLQRALDNLDSNCVKIGKAAPHLADRLAAFKNELTQATSEIIALVKDDILTERFSTTPEAYSDKATAAIDLGYVQLFDTLMPALEAQIQARIDRLQVQLAWFVAIAASVMLSLFWLLSGLYYAIVSAVRSLSAATGAMAAGDMTVRVRLDSRDELVEVADSVNQMGASLNGLLLKVQEAATQVTQASTALAGSSRAVARGSREQSDAAMSMAAAIEEMTAGINTIAKHAGTAENSSIESGEISVESARIVEDTVGEMQQIATTVRQSAQIIEELGHDTEHISVIVGAIREIADQTNLLALNAAIEAARAGEQGRGFAVVADEVRKLAERTSQQTGEIVGMITAIQAGTENAVASMKAGVERVDDGVAMSQQAGASIARVREGSGRVVMMVNEISVALREQSIASTEMAKNVEHIAQMSESNSVSVDSVAQTASALEKMAAELQNDVSRFRLG